MTDQNEGEDTKEMAYIRSVVTAMSEIVIPRLMDMKPEEVANHAISLSLLSPVVRNLEKTEENMRIHNTMGLGVAALIILSQTKYVNARDAQEIVDES